MAAKTVNITPTNTAAFTTIMQQDSDGYNLVISIRDACFDLFPKETWEPESSKSLEARKLAENFALTLYDGIKNYVEAKS